MKSLCLILMSLLLSTFTWAQGHNPNLSPSDTFSFVKIQLTNPNGTPYANSKVVLKGQNGHEVSVMTDKNGKARAKVPVNDTYSLYCGGHKAFRQVTVNSFPYVTYKVRGYTRRFIYFTFRYRNPAGIPLEGEEVKVTSTKTGEVYVDSTNAKGQCKFILPFDPEFVIAVKYHDEVKTLRPRDVGKEYKVMSTDFTWMGSKEKERRERVADSLARLYHADIIALLDSLSELGEEGSSAILDHYIPIDYDSTGWVKKMLTVKAKAIKKQLNTNPQFLEEEREAVLAPLYRLRAKFKNKIIVTDITGSMYPYMEQVLLWHALNFMQVEGQGTKYLFFNDGNRKSTLQKMVGKTGGLYFCQGRFKDFDHIINSMRKGMRAGGGGDGPENDIEALLAATARRSKTDEVILIADNHSTMRDYSLLKELKIPVRVILCGIEGSTADKKDERSFFLSSTRGEINEEYLNLAYETGGSVHTVKDDIFDLAKTQDGDSITIQGKDYLFQKGKFLLQKKM